MIGHKLHREMLFERADTGLVESNLINLEMTYMACCENRTEEFIAADVISDDGWVEYPDSGLECVDTDGDPN